MKKELTKLVTLLLTATLLLACDKGGAEEALKTEEAPKTVVPVQDSIVGKWYQKKYEQSYFQNNGTVKTGGSSTVDFTTADFLEFTADGTYKNSSVTAKYTRTKDKIEVTGLATSTGKRDYYIKQLTATDLQLFYTTFDSQNYRYETLLTFKK